MGRRKRKGGTPEAAADGPEASPTAPAAPAAPSDAPNPTPKKRRGNRAGAGQKHNRASPADDPSPVVAPKKRRTAEEIAQAKVEKEAAAASSCPPTSTSSARRRSRPSSCAARTRRSPPSRHRSCRRAPAATATEPAAATFHCRAAHRAAPRAAAVLSHSRHTLPWRRQTMREILYYDLKKIQANDEQRLQMGGFKMMPWLSTKIHIDRTGWSRMRCAPRAPPPPPPRAAVAPAARRRHARGRAEAPLRAMLTAVAPLSRARRVGYALAVISLETADFLQCERYISRQMGAEATASAQAAAAALAAARMKEAEEEADDDGDEAAPAAAPATAGP